MNNSKLAGFKAAILAEAAPAVVAARNGGDHVAIAEYYSAPSTTVVWKTSVSRADILEAVADGIGALTADQRQTLGLLQSGEVVPCDRARVRTAFFALFPSGGNNARLLALFKRNANRAEALSATGGAGDDANPHNLRFEGVPDSALVGAALRSN